MRWHSARRAWALALVAVTTADTAAAQVGVWGSRHSIGVAIRMAHFWNLGDVVADQQNLSGANVTSTVPSLSFNYEYRPSRAPVFLGLLGLYSPMGTIEQTFTPTLNGPTMSDLNLDVFGLGPLFGWDLGLGGERVDLMAMLSFLWFINRMAARSWYDDLDDFLSEDRTESGLRAGLSVGADWRLSLRTALRLEAGFFAGSGKDADNHFSLGLGVQYTPGRKSPF